MSLRHLALIRSITFAALVASAVMGSPSPAAADENLTGALATRIDNLNDFNVVSTLVVYFKNGRIDVSRDWAAQLVEFGAKAKTIDGYRLQVEAYASDDRSALRNEVLSLRRAHAVAGVLMQHAAVPPANVFVPERMAFSEQVADGTTAKGQSQNCLVIVTILQSKGQRR